MKNESYLPMLPTNVGYGIGPVLMRDTSCGKFDNKNYLAFSTLPL